MKYLKALIFIIFLIVAGYFIYQYYLNSPYGKGYKRIPGFGKQQSMVIKSTAFSNNAEIPEKYTCDGADVNPPFGIFTVPIGAKSLVLTMEDADSPIPDFTHWLLFNIPATANGIGENSIPDEALEGLNDFGNPNYGGPCPGSGTHHYIFKLYALDTVLTIERGSTKPQILNSINKHILEETQLIGTYKRK